MARWRSETMAARIFDSVLCGLIIGIVALSISGIFEPRGAGFFCNDQSIMYPYKGDSISIPLLLVGSLIGPLLFILPVEWVRQWRKNLVSSTQKSYVKKLFGKVWHRWANLLLGELIVLSLTELTKSVVSEPRPHFWETCKPNVTDCAKSYVTAYRCTSDASRYMLSDAQKSFPSAHAALSVFATSYMMKYLRTYVQWQKSFLLQPGLQLIWTAFALFVSLSRITDHRHHWWDVLAGAVLGFSVSLYFACARRRKNIQNDAVDVMDVTTTSPKDTYSVRDNNSTRKLSIRRLLSTSSSTCGSIAEDRELQDVNQGP